MFKSLKATGFVRQMPAEIRIFLTRALILFIAWKLLYHLVLFPARVPDQQLTRFTANGAAFLYTNLMGEKMLTTEERHDAVGNPYVAVYSTNKKLIAIADSCNGLELIVLFVGFLFCFPKDYKRQVPYMLAGTVLIIVCNLFRCYGLTWMYIHDFSLADFFHKYLFKMAIYGMIFAIWMKYSKKYLNA